ncbi:MAG: hypothetical protein M3Z96_08645, partial [Pseudomonadota bacterium]|nr:hypothetical protein [Pseudomonadota bacterium]
MGVEIVLHDSRTSRVPAFNEIGGAGFCASLASESRFRRSSLRMSAACAFAAELSKPAIAARATPPFYIRSHGTIPRLAAEGYKLRIGGQGTNTLELSVDDLRSRFPH